MSNSNLRNSSQSAKDKYTNLAKSDPLNTDFINGVRPANTSSKPLFTIKSANEVIEEAKKQPTPKMLAGELWFEGELCVLFSFNNLGKSILAVQIANAITQGASTLGLKMEAEPQTVLYFDFELSPKQREKRYSEEELDNKRLFNHYVWSDLMKWPEMDLDVLNHMTNSADRASVIFNGIKCAVDQTGAKILIIDNVTKIGGGEEKAKDAMPFMDKLLGLRNELRLSILLLAHTPKREYTKPITSADVSGSIRFMDFADSAFAINRSTNGDGERYIKQVKVRSCAEVYGESNVIHCRISKPRNFLRFDFIGYDSEYNHIRDKTTERKAKYENTFQAIMRKGHEFSNADLLNLLEDPIGDNAKTAQRWIKGAMELDVIKLSKTGKYYLP